MNLKLVAILLVILLGFGVLIMVATNDLLLVMLIGAIVVAIFFYVLWKKGKEGPTPPYTLLKDRLLRAITQGNSRTLGFLMLSGDHDFQRVQLGKIVGFTRITPDMEDELETNGLKKKHLGKDNGWARMYVIGYKTLYKFPYNLPFVRSFVPIQMFAVPEHQLMNKPGIGDVYVKGVSIEPVFCFWMLNAIDLEKDYVAHMLAKDVHRVTLEQYFNKLPSLIDDAVKSDGVQTKLKELLTDKPKGRTGIP